MFDDRSDTESGSVDDKACSSFTSAVEFDGESVVGVGSFTVMGSRGRGDAALLRKEASTCAAILSARTSVFGGCGTCSGMVNSVCFSHNLLIMYSFHFL